MISNVVLVSERYCDGLPYLGLSDNEYVTYRTLVSSGLFKNVEHLHVDVGNHIDTYLLDHKADLYIFVFFGSSRLNPSPEVISKLEGKKIFVWPDTVWPWIYTITDRLRGIADLHLPLDIPSQQLLDFCFPTTMKFLGHPLDESLYNYSTDKHNDVVFMGSLHTSQRTSYLSHLVHSPESCKFTFKITHGQRSETLPKEEYVQTVKTSKIMLHFTSSPNGTDQLKGRAHEALACRVMLLQNESEETRKWLIPGIHYVEFSTKEDMMNKISYYLEHNDEREQIANNGYEFFKKEYTSSIYWKKVLDLIT